MQINTRRTRFSTFLACFSPGFSRNCMYKKKTWMHISWTGNVRSQVLAYLQWAYGKINSVPGVSLQKPTPRHQIQTKGVASTMERKASAHRNLFTPKWILLLKNTDRGRKLGLWFGNAVAHNSLVSVSPKAEPFPSMSVSAHWLRRFEEKVRCQERRLCWIEILR